MMTRKSFKELLPRKYKKYAFCISTSTILGPRTEHGIIIPNDNPELLTKCRTLFEPIKITTGNSIQWDNREDTGISHFNPFYEGSLFLCLFVYSNI